MEYRTPADALYSGPSGVVLPTPRVDNALVPRSVLPGAEGVRQPGTLRLTGTVNLLHTLPNRGIPWQSGGSPPQRPKQDA
jgi:hypothetical protein